MLTRNTVAAALAGVFVTLIIVGGFLALDRTTLHWYAEADAPTGLTAAEAEAHVISHVDRAFDGWFPDCEVQDRSEAGWLVRCGMTHMTKDTVFPQILTYLVGDDGAVASFP